MAQHALFGHRAAAMSAPVLRPIDHKNCHCLVERAVAIVGRQVGGDQVERIEGLAQHEGQFRSDLEDREAVLD